jgi:dihydroorotate dehydrogenase (NAD+) catalytic subunit
MSSLLTELGIENPWMNVPGFLGYLPPAHLDFPLTMGAFLPPPLSLIPRTPVENHCAVSYPGGVLLHTGLPNPGLTAAARIYAQRWARLAVPVWLNLMPNNGEEAETMSSLVDELENVAAYQVSLPREADAAERKSLLAASGGEKPFLVEIPLDQVNEDLLAGVKESNACGVLLSAPRGKLQNDQKWVRGRLYGPALFPQVVDALRRLRALDKPILVGTGVYTAEQAEALLGLGVEAVQFDLALWA